ncbi:MAG: rod shape-determining protein MreD [Tepidibacter sp.]|jgi:rod shape-determining protein MreD|uniref:rod shape-determining protein MreD n=1 Tax=Tepidibacter sp. TaxID=2529387 RepID=UPI0025D71B8F|nr:rod shape-determining protein MreD [Tepidibacter sp.]MCT4508335.1 rod shape-determining protein MreD [Tepidibacter sp.]
MRNIILILIGIFIIIIENSIVNYIDIFNISLNLCIIYISIISLFIKRNDGALIGLILGILKDILIGRFIGVNALVFFIIGYLYGILKDKIFKESVTSILILTFFSSLFDSLINCLLLKSSFASEKILFSLIKGFVFIPALNMLFALIVYKALIDFVKKLDNI